MTSSDYESLIYQYIGKNGFYQTYINMCLLIYGFTGADPINFLTLDTPHWCKVPSLANFSHGQQKYMAIPTDDKGEYSRCDRFDFNFSAMAEKDFYMWNR